MSFLQKINALLASPKHPIPPMARPDADWVAKAVYLYCHRLGCDQSNTTAAVSWALRAGGDTLSAIRAGRDRAAQLLERQRRTDPPTNSPRSA
jgi:hypothetical protein